MWIPRWLGEIYSLLFLSFETELFTFAQAEESLDIDPGKLNVAFSKLHSEKILTIFKRSRPRVYRLLDPSAFVLLASEAIKNMGKLEQERYLPLILRSFRQTSKMLNTQSFAVYGSVARGTAGDDSDIDILIVSRDFEGSMGNRIEQLLRVEHAVQDETGWLRRHGVNTGLSFYPLKPDEAEKLPYLFLDLTEDAVILHDEGRFLEGLLLELKAKLLRKGAVRVFTDRDKWYWDLKPDYKFGEVVEIH
jgi:predicted nucleotidyltransferase